MLTFDRAARDGRVTDSAGAFLSAELEKLDPTIHEPIAAVTWWQDVDVREDVAFGDEFSSFINQSYAAPGGNKPVGKAWASKGANAITGIQVDAAKTPTPLTVWELENKYSIAELESSIQMGRPLDQSQFKGTQLKLAMDTDEQVYVGDSDLGLYGLINNPNVPATNAVAGGAGGRAWATKTADEIRADFNAVLAAAWASTGYAFTPTKVIVPPLQLAQLAATITSNAGNVSLLEYLRNNTIATVNNGRPLEIVGRKWAQGAGVGGTDRMVAYTQDYQRVRFPMTPMQSTNLQQIGTYWLKVYYCRLGAVEMTNREFVSYLDMI